jgi:hypothetical protein
MKTDKSINLKLLRIVPSEGLLQALAEYPALIGPNARI